ncbi:hypothetical protein Y1Q_0013297 [Alligator mississippiensis]|uniref:Uncharacterized protein n=1 Tax=Alligator mississippiensis TaxID=8496 RepID=A0A151NUK7_ALLMI|nr:hypothetical protein Y1Q_0013297 [Alligator mississippiensis]
MALAAEQDGVILGDKGQGKLYRKSCCSGEASAGNREEDSILHQAEAQERVRAQIQLACYLHVRGKNLCLTYVQKYVQPVSEDKVT